MHLLVPELIFIKMTASKELNPGTEFSVSIHYTGFDKPRTVIEKGKNDPKSIHIVFKVFTFPWTIIANFSVDI